MEHIYIFDYVACKIYHGLISGEETAEDFIERKGLKFSDVYFLISQNPLNIEEL